MFEGLLGLGTGLLNFFGQQNNNRQQMQLAQQQMAMQREFAQNGIQWRVQDAVAAGIHPLAALGASTASPSPVSVGGDAPRLDFGNLGQSLDRAFKASQSEEERVSYDVNKARKLQLEKGALENDLLRQELRSNAVRNSRVAGQIGPPMPTGWGSFLTNPPLRSPYGDPYQVEDDPIKQKKADVPAQVYTAPFGYPLKANPRFSDGQTTTNRYGESEILETGTAIANLIADHWHTYGPGGGPISATRLGYRPPRRAGLSTRGRNPGGYK